MSKWFRWLVPVFAFGLICSVATAAPVELSVWGWLPGSVNGDIFDKYVKEFNATHPDIQVKVDKGSNEQQLVVAFAAGAAPDLVQGVGPWATALGERGILLPLDSYIDGPQGFPRADFIDDLWSFSTVNGKTYQLAADSNERALFVAVDAAMSSGVDTKRSIRDWNDLLTWAKKMTVRTGDGVERWGFDANQENGGSRMHWAWLNEGEIVAKDGSRALFDNRNTIEAVQFAGDMINQHGVAPQPGKLSGGAQTNFINGKLSMMITSSQFITNLNKAQKEFITIPGPPGVGKKGYRFSGATASIMAITRNSKHPQEAWTFLRWLMYEKGASFAADRGGLPYLKKALRNERYFKQPWDAFAISVNTFAPRNAYLAGVSESDWLPHYDGSWASVMRGEIGAETILKQALESVNARFAELKGKK